MEEASEGFWERLTGCGRIGRESSGGTPAERCARSVAGQLERLAEVRRGSLAHLPEYGFPDLAGLFRRLPDSSGELRQEMETAIRRHEPRLGHARVSLLHFEPGCGRLNLRVQGVMPSGERLRLLARISSEGRFRILSQEPACGN